VARSVVFHPEASEEALEAQGWYAVRSELAAEAFGHEMDLVVRRVAEAPERYPRHLHGTRRLVFPRFPFDLVYLESVDLVRIVAVAHHRRRPGYWRQRAKRAG